MEFKLFILLVIFTEHSHQEQQFYAMSGPLREGSRQITNSLANKVALEAFKFQPDRNLIVSPLAMRFPLCKLADVSVGDAKRELMSALGLNREYMVQNCFKDVKIALSLTMETDLVLLNKIYLKDTYKMSPHFKVNLTEVYGIQLEQIGFKYPKAALRHINGWLENLTFKRIQDVLQPHEVNKNTSMVIVNAAHYKATWQNQFDLKNTTMGKFQLVDHRVVMVPMMHKYDSLLYTNSGGYQIITTNMASWGSTMTIVLPQTPDGIKQLLNILETDPEFIRNAKRNSKYTIIKLQMPRIKIKSELDFNNYLRQIGITKIFDATDSGLRNITISESDNTENVYLSKAKQKLFIDIDEYGVFRRPRTLVDEVEEAVHYGKYESLPMGPGKHVDFKVDKPFLFTVNVLGGDTGSLGPDGQGKGIPSEGPWVSTNELFVGVYYGPED